MLRDLFKPRYLHARLQSRQFVSEERLSIRDSLRIFNKIDGSNHSLEDMCRHDNGHKVLFTPQHNCGNTMRCFLSLFLDDKNIHYSNLDYIMNGNTLQQFYNNTNVLFCTYNLWESVFKDINDNICLNNFIKFKKTILDDDKSAILPRVFFVSLVWSSKSNRDNSFTAALNDHKFTIIKYSNENFRLIMGHINTHNNSDHTIGAIDNSIGLTAYKLKPNSFNDIAGFNKNSMRDFVNLLEIYIRGDAFDNRNYKEMFAVTTTNNPEHNLYMPSFYHFELMDSALSGYGHINRLAKRIETRL